MKFDTTIERPHRTVTIEVGDRKEDIDEGLASLITEIWKAGIETIMSCEEVSTGIAWIEFSAVNELLRFLNLIAHYESNVDSLYNRINNQLAGHMSAQEWTYQLNLMDIFEGQDEQLVDGVALFEAAVGVYFPTTDIPSLLQRLEMVNSPS